MTEEISSSDVSHLPDPAVMALVSTLNQTDGQSTATERVARDMPPVETKVTVRFVEELDTDGDPEEVADDITCRSRPDPENRPIRPDILHEAEDSAESDEFDLEVAEATQLENTPAKDDVSATGRSLAERLGLTPAEFARLEDATEALLEWINESNENAAKFVVDPVTAVEQSDVDIGEHLLAKLRNIHDAQDGFSGHLAVPSEIRVETGSGGDR